MKNDSFALLVQELKTTDQNQLIGQLQKVFHAVTQFDADQAISTYQALSFMGEVFEGDDGQLFIQRVKEAVEARMSRLAWTNSAQHREFERIVGHDIAKYSVL